MVIYANGLYIISDYPSTFRLYWLQYDVYYFFLFCVESFFHFTHRIVQFEKRILKKKTLHTKVHLLHKKNDHPKWCLELKCTNVHWYKSYEMIVPQIHTRVRIQHNRKLLEFQLKFEFNGTPKMVTRFSDQLIFSNYVKLCIKISTDLFWFYYLFFTFEILFLFFCLKINSKETTTNINSICLLDCQLLLLLYTLVFSSCVNIFLFLKQSVFYRRK